MRLPHVSRWTCVVAAAAVVVVEGAAWELAEERQRGLFTLPYLQGHPLLSPLPASLPAFCSVSLSD